MLPAVVVLPLSALVLAVLLVVARQAEAAERAGATELEERLTQANSATATPRPSATWPPPGVLPPSRLEPDGPVVRLRNVLPPAAT